MDQGTGGVAHSGSPRLPGDSGTAASELAPGMTLLCKQPTGNAALVDSTPITVERLCSFLARIGAVRDGVVDRKQARMILDQLIDASLVSRALETAGTMVGETELREALANLRGSAVDSELLKEQLRQQLETHKLASMRSGVDVTNAEVDAELSRGAPGIDRGQGIRVEAYVRRVAPSAGAEQQETSERAAKDFATAISTEKPEAAAGRLGLTRMPPFVLGPDGLEPELEAVAETLRPGQWSGAIRTRVGWTVVRVIERVEGTKLDDKQLRARVRKALETRKLDAARVRLLATLRSEARIDILVDF